MNVIVKSGKVNIPKVLVFVFMHFITLFYASIVCSWVWHFVDLNRVVLVGLCAVAYLFLLIPFVNSVFMVGFYLLVLNEGGFDSLVMLVPALVLLAYMFAYRRRLRAPGRDC